MTYAAICLAFLIPCAAGDFASDIVEAPRRVVEGQPFTVRASYRTPGTTAKFRAELKNPGNVVLAGDVQQVQGEGEMTFHLTAPSLAETGTIQIAVWLGEDWREPRAPIVHTARIEVMSTARAAHLAQREREAPALQRELDLARTNQGLVLLYPASDVGAAELAAAVAGELKQSGLGTLVVGADTVVNANVLTPQHVDALVLCGGRTMPAESFTSIADYAAAGGNLVVLGGPAFETPLYELDGEWVTVEQYRAAVAATLKTTPLYRFETDTLGETTRSTNQPDNPSKLSWSKGGAAGSAGCLEVDIKGLAGWDTFALPPVEEPFGKDRTWTSFWAKGDDHTNELALEWTETDGSRWIATVPLSTEWRPYVLPPSAFHYWQSAPDREQDRFRPQQAERLTVGLAFTHTSSVGGGDHRFWLDDVGTAEGTSQADELSTILAAQDQAPIIEGVSPSYKLYAVTNLASLRRTYRMQVKTGQIPRPASTLAIHPRPSESGWQKERRWQFISLLEALDDKGRHVGDAAALILAREGGATLSAPITDPGFWRSPGAVQWVAASIGRMLDGLYLQEGGAAWYATTGNETIPLGATVVNRGKSARRATVSINISGEDGHSLWYREWPVEVAAGGQVSVDDQFKVPTLLDDRLRVAVGLLGENAAAQQLLHEILVWRPSPKPSYLTTKDGHFDLGGHRWIAHGVNYMPSSGIGIEDGAYFEYWLDPQPYDPVIIERDLDDCVALGFNMVSVFCYYRSLESRNLLHLLTACRERGLKVNLSIRPGTGLDFRWSEMRAIVETNRIAENDTVIAYDIAWEPHWGNFDRRKAFDSEWRDTIDQTYGSVAKAEAAWGCPANRLDGQVVGPTDEQFSEDGPHRPMVLAYRQFQRETLQAGYSKARELLQSIDPHHLVSFRMSIAGDPTISPGWLGYDFDHLRDCVDLLEPEGYGRIGDWERVKPGWFTTAYARAVAPKLPVMWAEFGTSVWNRTMMEDSPERTAFAGEFYNDFYKMAYESDCDGTVCWWFPGGYRVGERSDYGILNPDRSWRPCSQAIADWAPKMTADRPPRKPDVWIDVQPTESLNGIEEIYHEVKDRFWLLIAEGHWPGLRVK